MKTLSDVFLFPDGTFGIEWQETSGGRWWERFPTELDRTMALCKYQEWVDANMDEFEKQLLEQKLEEIGQMIRWGDVHTDLEKSQVMWYEAHRTDNDLTWSDYQDFLYKERQKN